MVDYTDIWYRFRCYDCGWSWWTQDEDARGCVKCFGEGRPVEVRV